MSRFLFLMLAGSVFMNCMNNVEDQVPEIPTGTISYADQIQPIFNNSCGGSFCHTNGDNANGVNLDSYQNALNSSGNSYGRLIIVPDSAEISPLVDKLGSNPDFGSQMPLGRSALSSTEIGQIIAWINQGALNN